MSDLIISVSGLRGVVGESLTAEIAARYALAFASTLGPGPLVLTRDGRASGPALARAIATALSAAGRPCLDAGVAATPTAGVLTRARRAAGGIQISASHNPAEYNGIKLFSSAGRVLTATEGEEVRRRYLGLPAGAGPIETTQSEGSDGANSEELGDPLAEHLSLLLAIVDAARIRSRRFVVVVDSNHGAGGALARRLLEALGCRLTILGETPDGRFEHLPEPTAQNLASVLAQVSARGADIGFCQDPDADRLAVIDATGRYLGEEYTLAMCVKHVLRGHPGPVVTNCSTSRMTEDLAMEFGVPYFRSAVGEANVVDRMREHDAVLGGEGNGGVIDPRVGYVRDSFVGMALLLDAMAAREATIAQLADELPRYEIVKTKIEISSDRVAAGLDALSRQFPDARVDRLDGVRLDWPNQWLLARASNTEPIARAFAEAPTFEQAKRLCEIAGQVISGA